MDVAQRANGGLYDCQFGKQRGCRLALTLGPLRSCVGWHSRSGRLRSQCHMCHANTFLGLGPRTTGGTAGLAALPGIEQRQRRGSTAIVCAGGPSGGLQKVKRVRSGEVKSAHPYLNSSPPQWYQVPALTYFLYLQVDTLGKKLLVGTAFAYVGLVLFIPFINVFVQVCFPPLVGVCTCKHFQTFTRYHCQTV